MFFLSFVFPVMFCHGDIGRVNFLSTFFYNGAIGTHWCDDRKQYITVLFLCTQYRLLHTLFRLTSRIPRKSLWICVDMWSMYSLYHGKTGLMRFLTFDILIWLSRYTPAANGNVFFWGMLLVFMSTMILVHSACIMVYRLVGHVNDYVSTWEE